MTTVWRLIVDDEVDGALNMALDRAAQAAREEGAVGPTLRLYRWARPTASIGRFQPASEVDREYCACHGIDLVRRPTGGRGVLHDDEVTYAVIANVADGVPRGVAASYRYFSGALARAYRLLGVDAGLVSHDRAATASSACYLTPTRADLSAGALKLSGSAQVWAGSTVLQHGSFTRWRDAEREAAVFQLGSRGAARLREETVTLGQLLGEAPDFETIQEAVTRAFAEVLGVRFRPGCWSAREALVVREMAARRAGEDYMMDSGSNE